MEKKKKKVGKRNITCINYIIKKGKTGTCSRPDILKMLFAQYQQIYIYIYVHSVLRHGSIIYIYIYIYRESIFPSVKNLDKTGRKREQQRKRFYLSRLRLLESRIRKNEERERERKRASERESEREREMIYKKVRQKYLHLATNLCRNHLLIQQYIY